MANSANIILPLSNGDLDKLGKFLGMLGSEHPGERAVAGLKADALIRERGASWMQLTEALKLRVQAPPRQPRPQPKPEPPWKPEPKAHEYYRSQTGGWIDDPVKFCLVHSSMMTAWEKDFMRGIDGRRTLTPKQMEVVESVNAGSWRASRNSAKGNGQQTREDRTMAFTSSRPKLDLAAIRASNPLPAVVGASVKLLRAGNEWKACCPLHADRSPSFTIFDGGVRFHCFGCGASGDVLDYLQQLHGVSLPEAAAMLQGGAIPTVPVRALPVEPERDTTADAVSIWRSAVPATETPAEAYLRGRGLHLPIPPTVRFSRLRYGGRDGLHPCLVALLTSGDDKPVGIQRTFLTEQGRKADVPTVKLSLGRIRGAAIRLAPAAAELVVTGRLEDGLTLQQELGRPVWSSTGEGNMASMRLPDFVRSVSIGADNDESGESHARRAAAAFSLEGREARIIRPQPGFILTPSFRRSAYEPDRVQS